MIANDGSPWFRLRKPQPNAKIRLFCLPFAGGAATTYRSWQSFLGEQVEVCPIQLPGRENRFREAPFRRMSPLLEALGKVLMPYLDLPYCVFGHSLGAIIGFELCRFLDKRGRAPEILMVSARKPPELPVDVTLHDKPLSQLLGRIRELGSTPNQLLEDPDWLKLLEPLIRADFEIHETYQYQVLPKLRCPLVAFGGLDDSEVSSSQLAAWSQVTDGFFRMQMFSGGHFYINETTSVLHAVKRELDQIVNCQNRVVQEQWTSEMPRFD